MSYPQLAAAHTRFVLTHFFPVRLFEPLLRTRYCSITHRSYMCLCILQVYSQTATVSFVLILRSHLCCSLALVFALLALTAFLFTFKLSPFIDQTVHNVKTVQVLGVAALPFLDLCRQFRQLVILLFPLGREPLHLSLDFLFRAKTQVCARTLFEIGEAGVLASVPLQFTR